MNIGTIIQWGSNTIPNDWLLCDGSAVSRTTYADLFAVIGTNFGVGDGSTTFNLPDLRGRVGVGKTSETEFDTLGKTGGEKTHTLTIDEMPSHNHNIIASTQLAGLNSGGTGTYIGAGTTNTNNVGGTQPHNILQPYITTNYIIKALNPSEIKISELPEATTFDDSDLTMIVQSGENKKITKENIFGSTNDSITIGLGTDSSYTSATRGIVPFDTQMAKVGTKLTFSNYGIVIGKGVHYIEVSAKTLQSATATDLCGILICKNYASLDASVAVGFSYIGTANQMHCISISPIIIPVNENDIIYLVDYVGTGGITVQMTAYNGKGSYLTARVVS